MTIDFTLFSHSHLSIKISHRLNERERGRDSWCIISLSLQFTNVLLSEEEKRERTCVCVYIRREGENDDVRRDREKESVCVYAIFLFDSLVFRVRFFFFFINSERQK